MKCSVLFYHTVTTVKSDVDCIRHPTSVMTRCHSPFPRPVCRVHAVICGSVCLHTKSRTQRCGTIEEYQSKGVVQSLQRVIERTTLPTRLHSKRRGGVLPHQLAACKVRSPPSLFVLLMSAACIMEQFPLADDLAVQLLLQWRHLDVVLCECGIQSLVQLMTPTMKCSLKHRTCNCCS
jgi:hypothetical protein